MENTLDLLDSILKKAINHGADAADVLSIKNENLSIGTRLKQTEKFEKSDSFSIGLRIFIGKKHAMVSSNIKDVNKWDELVDKAILMAKAAIEDKFCGLALRDQVCKNYPNLNICDSYIPTQGELFSIAKGMEEAAFEIKGINSSVDSKCGWSKNEVALVASNGFSGTFSKTFYSSYLVAVAVDKQTNNMASDYVFSISTHLKNLKTPRKIGKEAGERAVKRLNAKKIKSTKLPIIFERRIAGSILESFLDAVSGNAIKHKPSFLLNKMKEKVLPSGINITDNAWLDFGIKSTPFDMEGICNKEFSIVEDGILKSWILDLDTARNLGMKTNGRAFRGVNEAPSPRPANVYIKHPKNAPTLKQAIKDISNGILITELMGQGVNLVNGEYSRGAFGFLIKNGEIKEPISEFTVAGNLLTMLQSVIICNDLKIETGIDSPSMIIDGMTIAGM